MSMKKIAAWSGLLVGFVLLTGAFPKKTSYDEAWARTAMVVPAPRGNGCIAYQATSGAAFVLERNGTNTDATWTLPLQVVVTNTATSTFILCAHQDTAPTINAYGYFSAGTSYSAGPGICRFFSAGSTDYFGVASDAFSRTGAGIPVGGTIANPSTVYLSAIMPGGSSENRAYICEVE